MPATAIKPPRFLRKTVLAENEYRRNFRQIDNDVIEVVTSPEADAITPLMSKIYLKLLKAPDRYVERSGILRFEEEIREGKRRTAWQALCEMLSVSSATANKAIKWLHLQGIIGYFSAKNGVGVRIFLNRASSSIGIKPPSANKKILPLSPALSGEARASSNEARFKGSFSNQENLETDKIPIPPNGGAKQFSLVEAEPIPPSVSTGNPSPSVSKADSRCQTKWHFAHTSPVSEILGSLKLEIESLLQSAAARAAQREHDKTRHWLETAGLPKVARVAQREAYNILRKHGLLGASKERLRNQLMVGYHAQGRYQPRPLSSDELQEAAEFCVTLLENRGQGIDKTLLEISAERGAYVLPEDVPKVEHLAKTIIRQRMIKEWPAMTTVADKQKQGV